MVYMEDVYKFGRLYGHTRDKIIFLLVKNASKPKIPFSDVKTGHMSYFFSSEIFVVYFNHLDEEFSVSLENYNRFRRNVHLLGWTPYLKTGPHTLQAKQGSSLDSQTQR